MLTAGRYRQCDRTSNADVSNWLSGPEVRGYVFICTEKDRYSVMFVFTSLMCSSTQRLISLRKSSRFNLLSAYAPNYRKRV